MNEDYQAFVDKFKPKLTTDDCYTPEPVMAAVLEYCRERYDIEDAEIIRPFWPGGTIPLSIILIIVSSSTTRLFRSSLKSYPITYRETSGFSCLLRL